MNIDDQKIALIAHLFLLFPLALTWNTSTWPNVIIKAALFLLVFVDVFWLLTNLGYIVKV